MLGRLNAAKDALEQDEHAANSEINKLKAQIEQLTADISRESGIVEDAAEAEALLVAEFEKLSAIKDTSAALDAAADDAKAAIEARTALENDHNELTRKSADQNARRESAARELSQAEQRLTRLTNEQESTQNKLASLDVTDSASANLFAAGASEALAALEAARGDEQKLAAAASETEQNDQDAREALADTKQTLSKLTAEQSALERVVSRGDQSDWTTAISLLDVNKGYEQALAAVLGEDLDAAIGGDATLRWNGAQAPSQALPNGATPLSDLVKAPKELDARLSQIGIVASGDIAAMASALKPGQRLVTQDGQVARWDGFEVAAGAETSAAIKLKQQNRLADLAAEVEGAEGKVSQAQAAFEAAREARNAAKDSARDARKALPDLERRDRAAQAALAQYETDVARESAQKTSLEDRLERLAREITELAAQQSAAQELVQSLEGGEDFSGRQQALSEELNTARARADEASGHYRSLKNESEARALRLAAVEKERSDWARRSQTAGARVATLQGRQDAAKLSLSAATDGPDQFEERRNTLFAELKAAEERRTSAADMLASAESAHREADIAAREAETAHGAAREARAAAQARQAAAQERISETKARINETLQCEPSELKSHLGELSPESGLSEHDIERKLERLSKEREKMGGVNLRADEEAVEQEERLAAMNDERQDLEAAIARLREGIDELNTEGRQRLLKAFDTVNGHFGRLFTTLFGGGEASLALTESDDPLEAGLEVMVSPPGKKLGSMSLMSGGEQALTATALIFAVFLSNPAPICVLDEVDAPLDDANVARYCNLLDEMVKQTKTKFITITHNAVTMSRMDRLFGVTMAEQGVSQLLSMELTAAERLVAAE